MRKAFWCAAAVWFGLPAAAGANEVSTLAQAGVKAYQAGRFADAVDRFRRAIGAGAKTADLYYNLGTAYYRLGQNGKAALAYHRALALAPRHDEARANLRVVERRLGLPKARGKLHLSREGFWVRVSRKVTASEAAIIFIVLYFLLFGALVARRFLQRGPIRSLVGIGALAMVVLATAAGGFLFYKVYRDSRVKEGIIVSRTAQLMEPKGDTWKKVQELPQGIRVRVVSGNKRWVQVRLSNGLTGYVRHKAIGTL